MHVDSYSYKMKYYFRLASLKKIKRKIGILGGSWSIFLLCFHVSFSYFILIYE